MAKTKTIKRKAVSMVLWHTIGIAEKCMYQLGEFLHIEGGTPVHRDHPLKGALTDKEFDLIRIRIERIRKSLEDLRKIAKHIGKNK